MPGLILNQKDNSIVKYWKDSTLAVYKLGLSLPEYRQMGLLFKYDSLLEFAQSHSLTMDDHPDSLKIYLTWKKPD